MKSNAALFIFLLMTVLAGICSSCTPYQVARLHGNQQQAKENYSGAVSNYTQAIELGDPANNFKDAMLYLVIADDKFRLKDYAGSIAAYDAYIGLNPHFGKGFFKAWPSSIYCQRAYVKRAALDFTNALADYSVALKLNPKNADAYYGRAFTYWLMHNDGAAITDFTRASQLHPEYPLPYVGRGDVEYARGDYVEAIPDFSQAIRLDPKIPDAYWMRAQAEFILMDDQNALNDLDKYSSLSPTNTDALCERARILIALNDRNGAITNLDMAIKSFPNSVTVRNSCGWSWRALGCPQAALTNFNIAIALNPTNKFEYVGAGLAQADMAQFTAALASLRKSQSPGPPWDYSWYHIYLVRSEAGEHKAAAEELSDEMKAVDPVKTNDWSMKVGEFLTGTLNEKDFFQQARDTALNPSAQRDHLCEAYYYAGMQHLLSGENEIAATLFQKCVATRQKDFIEYSSAKAKLNAIKNSPHASD